LNNGLGRQPRHLMGSNYRHSSHMWPKAL